jgi:hypothetical protein
MTKVCRNCLFFKDRYEVDDEVHPDGIGQCRRYPRIIIQESKSLNFFPDVMKENDWCGEWIEKTMEEQYG